MHTHRILSFVSLAYWVCACATAEPAVEVYNSRSSSNTTTSQVMSVSQAKTAVAELLQRSSVVSNGWSASAEVGTSQLVVHYQPNPTKLAAGSVPESHAFVYGSPEGMQVVQQDGFRVIAKGEFFSNWSDQESAIHFVEAVTFLEKFYTTDHTAESEAELTRFKPIAEAYRSKKTHPQIPEEARKYQIQAENDFDERRYDDSIRHYQKALEISPWWPEGHYSVAIILGQQGSFAEADTEMKKYLALLPDAPDARKARDKMYIWEGKLESLTPHTSAPAAAPAPKKFF